MKKPSGSKLEIPIPTHMERMFKAHAMDSFQYCLKDRVGLYLHFRPFGSA